MAFHHYGSQGFISNGSGVNGSKVATNDLVPDSAEGLTRLNDAQFSFPTFSNAELQAFIQFDFRKPTPDSSGEASAFRVGRDANLDGHFSFSEGIGIRYQNGGFSFDTAVNLSTPVYRNAINAGNFDDWFRLRLQMDFTANAGEGQGVLSYQNLTRGDGQFTTLTSGTLRLSNLVAGARPSDWNAFFIPVQRGNESDNLVVGVIPEPARLAWVAMVLGGLRRRARASRESVQH